MPTELATNPVTDWPSSNLNYYWQPYIQPAWTLPTTYITVASNPRCAWCQGQHIGKCDNLKSVKYRRDGTIERVEFFGEDDD
jgi:hypothetical protein